MIELNAVTYAYPGQESHPVFRDYDWQVERGDRWAILGPSGCGKTTLLYLLAGLRFATSGQLLVDGQVLNRPRPQTGLILQDYGLLPWATLRKNIELGLQIRRFYGPDGTHAPREGNNPPDVRAVNEWLNRLDIQGVADQYPGQVSGGQRQRAAIARTLILQPDLLLMDEPFSSLDAPTREALQALTIEICKERNLTLILVTHAIEEAAIMGRRILILRTPPTSTAEIMENPLSVSPNFRSSAGYPAVCRELRARLEMR
jgi:NitT/TauT family transport system ATP-binding protein